MKARSLVWLVLALAVAPVRAQAGLALQPVASNLDNVVAIANAGDGTSRLFFTLQDGRILVFDGTQLLATPFLDIQSLVSCCGEQGLLSVAFHPNYAATRYFYVNYTNTSGNTVIARYRPSLANPNLADTSTATILLTIAQPYANHNGGQLQFGPDGYLYIGMGDGGSGGDPENRAQNLSLLLGKMLRIDVDGGAPYAIPPDNPFATSPTARHEIWAYGLRNPWRFSFDRQTGDLLIGDVGQDQVEEIDFQLAASAGGENYGWRRMEGNQCYNPASGCNDGTLTLPVLTYTHASGCAVTGGYRYRGTSVAGLAGLYLYGDYCSGLLWTGQRDVGGAWTSSLVLHTGLTISTFGEDEAGEVYLADYAAGGSVYRITGDTPGLTLADVSLAEGNAGTTSALFSVTLSPASSQTVSVDYATADESAANGSDYTSASGTLTFAPGATTATLGVAVLGDALVEADETFTLTLSDAVNASIVDASATGTILNDDLGPGLSIDDVTTPEGDAGTSGAVFTVTLDTSSAQTLSVGYATAAGSATTSLDYIDASGVLTFGPGETSQTVGVGISGDTLDEIDETFTIALGNPVNGHLVKGSGVGTIADDDPPPSLSIADTSLSEGDGGAVPAAFAVTLSAPSGTTVAVAYSTSPGSATAGADYTPVSGTLTFAPGTTNRTIVVPVKGDYLSEADETFLVTLASPLNATLGGAQATGTILDDDQTPALSIGDARVTEGDSVTTDAVFDVTLSAPSGVAVNVDYATAEGSARSGSDYVASSGTLTIATGATTATLTASVVGDTRREGNETFFVDLTSPANAKLARARGQGVVLDDDGPADPCTPIATVPFTISTPGRYCLARSLTAWLASGAAIAVEADDVMVDLRGFAIRTTAGASNLALGVAASGRQHVSVRNGTLQGFYIGIGLDQTGPYVVQKVKAIGSTFVGIQAAGSGVVVADNQIVTTGGTAANGADSNTFGILAQGAGARIQRNLVHDTTGVGSGRGFGIAVSGADGARVFRNRVGNARRIGSTSGIAIDASVSVPVTFNRLLNLDFGIVFGSGATGTYVGNAVIGVTTPYVGGTPGRDKILGSLDLK